IPHSRPEDQTLASFRVHKSARCRGGIGGIFRLPSQQQRQLDRQSRVGLTPVHGRQTPQLDRQFRVPVLWVTSALGLPRSNRRRVVHPNDTFRLPRPSPKPRRARSPESQPLQSRGAVCSGTSLLLAFSLSLLSMPLTQNEFRSGERWG